MNWKIKSATQGACTSLVAPSAPATRSRAVGHNVLFVVCTLDVGGTESQMVQVAQRLKMSGHRISVVCLRPGGLLKDKLKNAGVSVFVFHKEGFLISLRGACQVLRLARFIRRNAFDVVHAHDLWANLMAVPAACIARVPVIFSSQRDLAHLYWYTPLRNKVIRIIHRLSTNVIANSAAVEQMLINDFHIPRQRVRIIHNGLDFGRFALAHGDRHRIFPDVDARDRLVAVVANMHSSVKGHHDLIEAARIICRRISQTSFVLVGDGNERPAIEEHVRRVGMQDHFIFLGRRADVPEVLDCCELSVLASRSEGFPNVVLEAMAAGLPVVATQVGGIPEIIEDGLSGLLVPPRDHRAIAEAVLRVMLDPVLAARLGRAGRQRVRTHFSFDRLIAETEKLYATALCQPTIEPSVSSEKKGNQYA